MQKRCSTCKVEKPTTEFNKRAKSPDGLQPRCRECHGAYYIKNQEKHKKACAANKVKHRDRNREKLWEILKASECADCGTDDFRVLEFDHVSGEKRFGISGAIDHGYSWATIEAEIEKCEIRCANCHRIRTGVQFGCWRVTYEADSTSVG